ncbi:LysR family transcriptional regulator [Scandinavium sp. NPDC088450]|uniref:LysR family transcriptional regulator n=1 Tax=Scandinavium sp. NPDC088450 TaxID=3364514 RepID=UPI00384B3EAB
MHTVDLKVLRAVHVLASCGSVTKTSEILNVTPGSVTYLLNKARHATGSALFFRTKNGMEPDSVAKELSLRYQKFTTEFEENDKKLSLNDRNISVSTYALLELIIGMSLNNNYPVEIVKFIPLPMNEEERLSRLRNKEVDLDLGSALPPDRSIIRSRVITSGVKIAVRKDHPRIKDNYTLEDWSKSTHIMWSRQCQLCNDDHHQANRFYDLLDKRNVVCTSSNSTNMLLMACYTDNIVIMPELVVPHFIDKFPIAFYDVPEHLAMRYEFHVHYHCSMAKDPSIEKMIQAVKDVVKPRDFI